MLLTIHDANLQKVAFIDNDKQATLNYFNDTWTKYLETGSSTFDFTVFKKAIISDVGRKRAYNYLNEKAFVSFQYKGKTYLHTIRKVEENEQIIKCYGINLNLELINEYANPYKAPKAMSFKEYCDAMDLLNFTFLKIGVNEISTQKISAEWEGADTKLNRLLSLAKKFGAEIEFDTHLNADSSIKSFVVNVYHENDDIHQGVGRISPTVLTYGKNLKTLTRTVDKTNIYNMVRPTGRTENGDIVTISGLSAWSVNNDKGEREFYQAGEGLYAPLSMQMYPSAFTSSTTNDQWIRKDMQVESANPEVIRSMAYRELKKNCYPAVTYEAEGFADLEIGDTVQVYDDGFSPVLLLEMRVSEQTVSFTNPKNNKTTFSNAKALENLLSNGIQERLDRMIEDAKPYTVKVSTDNGTAFKNGQGQSVVTPTLMKGNRVINSGWRWVVNGEIKATSPTYIVKAADINQTMVLTIAAWIDNQEVASEQITFLNASDGLKGDKGDPGRDGIAGKNGVGLQSTVITYASSSSGTNAPSSGWASSVPTVPPGQYLWTKTVWNYSDSTSETGYSVARIGQDGNTGRDGIAGKDGVGIRTTTVVYAGSTSGTVPPTSGWSSQIPSVYPGQYLWTKTTWSYTDNTSETGFSVAKMGETGAKGDKGDKGDKGPQGPQGPKGDRGNDGIAGKDGVGLKNTAITYGLSASEATQPTGWTSQVPTLVKGQYLWTRTIWTYTDNTAETGYQKTYISKDGNDGSDGVAGKDGVGIKSTEVTYTSSTSGTTKPTSGWGTDIPSVPAGSFLWTKTVWTYTDNTSETSYSVSKMGENGEAGKTTYPHWAYADNPTGTVGFSLKDGSNKQYQGYYSDYYQTASTDPTKYTWVDRTANVQVGGRNLAQKTSKDWSEPFTSFKGIENTPADLYKILVDGLSIGDTLKSRIVIKYTGIVSTGGQMATIHLQGAGDVTGWGVGSYDGSPNKTISGSGEVVFEYEFKITADHLKNDYWSWRLRTDYIASGSIQWKLAKVEAGTVFSKWSPALEDTQEQIDSKADQVLTQEQLNALNEKAGIIQAELEAKASADTLDNWIKAYQDFVKANDKARAQAEKDLISASQRVSAISKDLGELSDRWNFIDTYMTSSNEGLVIGKNDGSSSMMFNPNGRISMYSAGVEVMYISQGVIHIENGIFSKTIQIGRFREEQYHLNADMNVIRYVG